MSELSLEKRKRTKRILTAHGCIIIVLFALAVINYKSYYVPYWSADLKTKAVNFSVDGSQTIDLLNNSGRSYPKFNEISSDKSVLFLPDSGTVEQLVVADSAYVSIQVIPLVEETDLYEIQININGLIAVKCEGDFYEPIKGGKYHKISLCGSDSVLVEWVQARGLSFKDVIFDPGKSLFRNGNISRHELDDINLQTLDTLSIPPYSYFDMERVIIGPSAIELTVSSIDHAKYRTRTTTKMSNVMPVCFCKYVKEMIFNSDGLTSVFALLFYLFLFIANRTIELLI